MSGTAERILRLKEESNAVILAHNYQRPEVQDIADFVGDSLELARKARQSDADVIVFCGVDFMAETAKILNPDKVVLHPNRDAVCPMARMLKPEMIVEARKRYGGEVVLYVNTTAECKVHADAVCTSANAVDVVRSMESDIVIFGPDANLAAYVQQKVPEKKVIAVPKNGHCVVHVKFSRDDVEAARKKWKAKVVAHPECRPEVWSMADLVASTGGMVRNACLHDRWVVFTEREMCYRLKKLYPEKEFYPVRNAVCVNMKKITLESVLRSLENMQYRVELPESIMSGALKPIERMLKS